MPRLKNRPPKLCIKKSKNTAFVCVNGKEIYMGKVGSESEKNYRHFVSTWASGTLESTVKTNGNVSLEVLFSEYLNYLTSLKNYSNADFQRVKIVITRTLQLYPDLFVDNFGPLELESVRKSFFKSGFVKNGQHGEYSRKYLNRLVNVLRGIFKWGVAKTLVKLETHEKLKYVQPLRAGRTEAVELDARENVTDSEIDKTLPFLSLIYRDIIKLLRVTGMRPSEVCRLRICDIDRSRKDRIWIYIPADHKTKNRGKKRIIPLGAKAQEILKNRIENRAETDYLFTPADARREQWTEARKKRKSKITPSQIEREKKSSKRKFINLHEKISTASITRNVANAIKKAKKQGIEIKKWSPYCVRHQVVTEIAIKEGPVASQRLAGHSSLNTTEIYDHSALQELIALAKKYG